MVYNFPGEMKRLESEEIPGRRCKTRRGGKKIDLSACGNRE
jgi:hypothetical protein